MDVMADVIHELYDRRVYPPMSHPLADPAVSAVAARIGGLEVPAPQQARILEIGCCSGHHLLPLAQRWPESRFIGMDLSARSIGEARDRADRVGLSNIIFHVADLREFEPEGGPFDYIIAHGFFSWVPDEVKATLLSFCRRHLSRSGIATVSFNLECGWKRRLPVIAKVRAIQQARGGDEFSALEILRQVTDSGDPESAVIDDMLAKGAAILAFDDFGPVNDPWSLDRFARAAAGAGLRWLGESDPGENIPSCLSQEQRSALGADADDSLGFQLALDQAAQRTFRSGVLCRDDAPVLPGISLGRILDFSVRAGPPPVDGAVNEIHRVLDSLAPACVSVRELIKRLPALDTREVAAGIYEGITCGWVRPRIEPVVFEAAPPEFPRLDGFRLLCARDGLPLVDAWHQPCAFPQGHYQVLALMDGSRSRQELAEFSRDRCPELAFDPWLRHLAWRGMFA